MEMIEILAAIRTGRDLIAWALRQASLQQQSGEFTAEQLEMIRAEAGVADSAWDAAVEAAKQRLAQK